MTSFTFSYLPYPRCRRSYTGWLAGVRKPQPVPRLMLSWIQLVLYIALPGHFSMCPGTR